MNSYFVNIDVAADTVEEAITAFVALLTSDNAADYVEQDYSASEDDEV